MVFERLGNVGIDTMEFTPEKFDPQSIWMRFRPGKYMMLKVNQRNGRVILECQRGDSESTFHGQATPQEVEQLSEKYRRAFYADC